jgi:tetratricopeptide (TPR) repeat protein
MAPAGCTTGRPARRALLGAAVLGAVGWPCGARADQLNPGAEAQRRVAEGLLPAPLVLPAPAERRKPVTEVKIRFYADDEYRAGLFRWADRTRTQLNFLNQIVEPAFGIRFEAESFRRWHRESGSSDIYKMLAELEKLDPGPGVDWVVAYVSALPLITTSMHEIGAARLLGRHFVLRGMASADEARALGQAFDRLEPAEREQIYSQRKWHKEIAVFLHEWLHTLGGLHSNDPQRINHTSYSNKTSNLSITDTELAAVALQARLEGRARETIDWSALLGQLERASSPEWPAKERDELLVSLRSTGARATTGPSPAEPGAGSPGKLSDEEAATFKRAVALARDGKGPEAWTVLRPLGARQASNIDVQRLLCRLGFVPAARGEGLAACARARELGPDRPEPLIDAAQARILRKEPAEALAAVDIAAELAGRLTGGGDEIWAWIAQIYGQLGAFTRAEELLERVGKGTGGDAARTGVTQQRRLFGVPRPPAAGSVPPDREPAYAAHHRKAAALLDAGKLREARAAVDGALREFPGVPGLESLSCEIEVRQHRLRLAEKACERALGGMPDLPRAHYLMALVRLQSNARPAAVDELRKSIELDPRASGVYQTLAEVYRANGKQQELAALRAEYHKVFSRRLR